MDYLIAAKKKTTANKVKKVLAAIQNSNALQTTLYKSLQKTNKLERN